MHVSEQRLRDFLETSAALHDHLCPRQVLGVRMGMYAAELLKLDLPQTDKRLLTLVETDGCFADGVSASTGCWFGRRTLRLVDYGKVAATFIDTCTGEAIRIHPSVESRTLASRYAPNAEGRWHAYLEGYKLAPASELLGAERVQLVTPVEVIVSKPGHRVTCMSCQEEILNEREVYLNGQVLCRGCAEPAYFVAVPSREGSCVGM